jgi:hypothetical protein
MMTAPTTATKILKHWKNHIPDLTPKEPQHPKFQHVRSGILDIDNYVFESSVFRKLHLEIGVSKSGTEIIHAVMHPRPTRDIPILSIDAIKVAGKPRMAIADPCPVTSDLSLPLGYAANVKKLQHLHGIQSSREPPAWGKAIFSDCLVLTNGENPEAFWAYVDDLITFHLQRAERWTEAECDFDGNEVVGAHSRYRVCQLQNTRTRGMLVSIFGGSHEDADEYMRYVFDE